MSIRIGQREQLIAAVVLLAAVLLGSLLVLRPMVARARVLRSQVLAKETELQAAQDLVGRLAELRRDNEVLQARLGVGTVSTADMIGKLNRLAQTAGVNVTNTKPSEAKEIEFYHELKIEIWFEGDIGSVVRFCYSLMSDSGVLDVRQFTARPKQGSDDVLSCSADVFSVFVTEPRRGNREPPASTST